MTGSHMGVAAKRRAERKARRIFIFLCLFIIFGGLLAYGLYIFSYARTFAIAAIDVAGNDITKEEAVADFARTYLAGAYGGLFSKANIFFYPRRTLEDGILKAFPRVSSVHIEREGLASILISIEERHPAALWCGEAKGDAGAGDYGECFFIDDRGLIYARAPDFSGTALVRLFGSLAADEEGAECPVGCLLKPPGAFEKLLFYAGLLKNEGIAVRAAALSDGTMEIIANEDFSFFFDADEDTSVSESAFHAVLQAPLFKDGLENFNPPLEYVDVRYGNKAFYKFRE
ncbi:hypothetical protein L0Y41_00885 [bacterium]|nr:hypothetical protein [bacterium]